MIIIDRKYIKTMPYTSFLMYMGYRNLVNDNYHAVKRGANEE